MSYKRCGLPALSRCVQALRASRPLPCTLGVSYASGQLWCSAFYLSWGSGCWEKNCAREPQEAMSESPSLFMHLGCSCWSCPEPCFGPMPVPASHPDPLTWPQTWLITRDMPGLWLTLVTITGPVLFSLFGHSRTVPFLMRTLPCHLAVILAPGLPSLGSSPLLLVPGNINA